MTKIRSLIEHLSQQSPPDWLCKFDPGLNWPHYGAESSDDATYLAEESVRLGYLKREQGGLYGILSLWGDGNSSRLRAPVGGPSEILVVMSFDKALESAYEEASGAAFTMTVAGSQSAWISLPKTKRSAIKSWRISGFCRFMVTDFTLHRQSVYFEAGFALGLEQLTERLRGTIPHPG